MLLDTSGLMCLLDKRQIRHLRAINLYNAAVRVICHNYVLAELVALTIARRLPRSETLEFIETIVRSGEIELIWIDRDLHERAMRLLSQRIDKAWSLCDAISFVVMEDHGLVESLTTDHNFEQAGFVKLLDS